MRGLCSFVFCIFIAGNSSCQEKNSQAQAAPAPSSAQAATQLNYPDKPAGLEKLVKNIFRAEKDGDADMTDALVKSLVLPDPRAWYAEVFGEDQAARLASEYEKMLPTLPGSLAATFRNAHDAKFTDVTAIRHEQTCDDNAGELIYPVLLGRVNPVPLYELRLSSGNSFKRVWAFAYVGGGFRYAGSLRPPDTFARVRRPAGKSDGAKPEDEFEKRVRMGGAVVAASIVKRVQPHYPEKARMERLQGKVILHAIIAKDGSIKNLQVLQGYCSLAEASVAAVKQWRYRPTLLYGQPVEVDTTIDVTFTLN